MFPYLIILLFVFTGCNYFQEGTLSVKVESQGQLLANSSVTLYQVNEVDKKRKKIIEGNTNSQGFLKWKVDFSKLQQMKIFVQSNNLDKIYFPEIVSVNAPKWWQDRDLNLSISLKEIPLNIKEKNDKIDIKNLSENETILDFPLEPLNQTVTIAQIEENLPAETFQDNLTITTLSENDKQFSNSWTEKTIFKNSPILNTITEKKSVLFEDTITITVYSQNRPIEDAYVFFARNGTQSVRLIGSTDSSGVITTSVLHSFRPDSIVVKKDNFITNIRPLASGSGKQELRIEVTEGKSSDFLIQNYAYFVGRGIDKTELKLNSLKLDVSGMLGFVSTPKQLDEKSFLSITQKNAIPNNIDYKTLKKTFEVSNLSNQLPILYVSALQPYRPAVGLVEPSILGVLQNNSIWRRARREFFSRFMNEMSQRSIISDEVNKIANSLNLSAIEFAQRGWKDTVFAGDIDILMQIAFEENENGKDYTLIGKVFDKTGKVIFEKDQVFSSEEAEKTAANLYSLMLFNLPLEGNIIKKNKKEVTINLGKINYLSGTDLFAILAQKNPMSPPERVIGYGKVKEILEKESVLEIQVGQELVDKNEVLRVIRYPESVIQNEIQKRIAGY
ncbi:hypothetical protein QEJ31_13575 [Pigmentibacter sp. JX0631]|uniref:hypothetical protein n=1 Tax=Pigmentibacter sp. JX0631 TaxID=2976982 RepID=UPI0024689FA2|nr:hypothetical protein [Pigmentibacter sp. JX0631]WGL59555.1 hypothetical protein QEJ31_13575 [Pigmentibacter sp. JX0631]